VERSDAVRDGILAFYEAFSSGDPAAFAAVIADAPGVSVTGSAPDEGHDGREDWIATYERGIPGSGITIEGDEVSGYEEGGVGWGVDRPAFVMADGSRLPTRLSAVLHREDDAWKIVHLHFSVGVPDEDALQPASGS
jgi:ketosteroid isomerase-like protein